MVYLRRDAPKAFLAFVLALLAVALGWARVEEGEVGFVPWSGHWWPYRYGGLATGLDYRGHPAPTEKYELYLHGTYPRELTRWELQNHYKPSALPWEGLCHGRASAAAYEPMEFFPSSLRNVPFRVGDKKGLMTLAFSAPLPQYPLNWSPQEFHRFLLEYVKGGKRAVVADLDPSEEKWFYPIYRFRMEIKERSGLWEVHCTVWYSLNADPDYPGSLVQSKTYTYVLYLDGGEVTGGQWTGGSVTDHPEWFFVPLAPGSDNPYLDYGVAREIALSRDDFMEGNPWMGPGTYRLVLLDEDDYFVASGAGEGVRISLTDEDPQLGPIFLQVEDGSGRTILQREVRGSFSAELPGDRPPYRLALSRADYGPGGIYTLQVERAGLREYIIPWVQKGGAWRGIALLNPTGEETIVALVAYDQGGVPLRTVWGPYSLGGKNKVAFLIDPLLFPEEKVRVSHFVVFSDRPLRVLYLSGTWAAGLQGFVPEDAKGGMLVVPEVQSTWGIVNGELQGRSVRVRVFGKGRAVGEGTFEIGGRASLRQPLDPPEGEWALVDLPKRGEAFSRWLEGSWDRQDSLLALRESGTRFFVPHVADDGFWSTFVTLINLGDGPNEVELRLFGPWGEERRALVLEGFERKRLAVAEVFQGVRDLWQASLQIEGESPFTGFFTYLSPESSASMPLALSPSTELYVPHVAEDGYWWTGIALFNPTDKRAQVTLLGRDDQGRIIQEVPLALDPKGKKALLARSLFPQGVSWVEIRSDQPVVGLYLYGGPGAEVLAGGLMD